MNTAVATPSPSEFAVMILAAGKGTRMVSDLPKVLHPVGGAPMVAHVVRAARAAHATQVVVVTSAAGEQVETAALKADAAVRFAQQTSQRGTGDAVHSGLAGLPDGWDGVVVVAYGDTPLTPAETLRAAANAVQGDIGVCVVGIEVTTANAYGRLVLDSAGDVAKIVEFKDASEAERAITLCNSGVIAARASTLRTLLPKLTPANAQGELYLTDIVALARAEGLRCVSVAGDAVALSGVNSKVELAAIEAAFQARMRHQMLVQGVTLIAPETVFFAYDTQLGRDCVVHPFVVFGPNVCLGDGVEVKGFSHIEGATTESQVKIGPFARLRPGSVLGAGVQVGNFVELKKTTMDAGAKASHLAYLGDATIGARANIGAGTITCNYDGFDKFNTIIGKQAFIGSNTALVAPVTVGDGAMVGAGSVITDDVEADSLAIARPVQKAKPGWAKLFRTSKNN